MAAVGSQENDIASCRKELADEGMLFREMIKLDRSLPALSFAETPQSEDDPSPGLCPLRQGKREKGS